MSIDLTAVCARHGIITHHDARAETPWVAYWPMGAEPKDAEALFATFSEEDAVCGLLRSRYGITTWGARGRYHAERDEAVESADTELTAVVAVADRLKGAA